MVHPHERALVGPGQHSNYKWISKVLQLWGVSGDRQAAWHLKRREHTTNDVCYYIPWLYGVSDRVANAQWSIPHLLILPLPPVSYPWANRKRIPGPDEKAVEVQPLSGVRSYKGLSNISTGHQGVRQISGDLLRISISRCDSLECHGGPSDGLGFGSKKHHGVSLLSRGRTRPAPTGLKTKLVIDMDRVWLHLPRCV